MTSIGEQYGFLWSTIWEHEKNAELRAKRTNPNILMAGDQVFIPEMQVKEESATTGSQHIFRLKGVPARLNLRLTDGQRRPRAGLRYSLKVDGTGFTGTTGDNGELSHAIPPHARKAHLKLEATGEEWDLDIGHMNPMDYGSGIQARLRNLGYYCGSLSGAIDEATQKALREYQRDRGLPVTGKVDAETRQALESEHES